MNSSVDAVILIESVDFSVVIFFICTRNRSMRDEKHTRVCWTLRWKLHFFNCILYSSSSSIAANNQHDTPPTRRTKQWARNSALCVFAFPHFISVVFLLLTQPTAHILRWVSFLNVFPPHSLASFAALRSTHLFADSVWFFSTVWALQIDKRQNTTKTKKTVCARRVIRDEGSQWALIYRSANISRGTIHSAGWVWTFNRWNKKKENFPVSLSSMRDFSGNSISAMCSVVCWRLLVLSNLRFEGLLE